MTLNRLSTRETLALAGHILAAPALPKPLEDLVLEKTEGVPFFVEEFLKSLRDLRIVEKRDQACVLAKDPRDVAIPSTIQDVLMARADALPEGAKEVLQTASAIEREFSHALLRRVTALPEPELLSHLSALKDAELLYERGVYPESTYIFKHALTREVLYDSILASRRRELHGAIGAAMEEIYRDRLEEHCGVLCHHFVTGERWEKGAEYAKMAAREAERDGSFIDAEAFSRREIWCLEKLPATPKLRRRLVDARAILGLYLLQMGHFAEAEAVVEPVLELAAAIGDKKRLSQLLTVKGTHQGFSEGDYGKSISTLTEALELAEASANSVSIFFANYWLGCAFGYDGQWENAARHIESRSGSTRN